MVREAKKDSAKKAAEKKIEERLKRIDGVEEHKRGVAKVMWQLNIGKNLEKAIAAFSEVAVKVKLGDIIN
jgi:hypothetical protein